ncbi:serine/threonine-protein kinase [Streptomyces sp. BRB081]|uniref:serine/threonine-protein kinase n=1 Tax=Streptomyces sp. BRB081 TaxID=2769544 RepID=UPI0018AD04E1|nr:serine/threonine-protein kinase [Streptomyces sp. BRB081]MBL3807225.1 protein kinase [Streptomyces sp. BRB081]
MSAPGEMIGGRFTLLGPLGSGGMGTVWRARDEVLHREVALKEVRPPDPALTGPEAAATLRERVLREARALARLSHPHVVTVHQTVDAGAGTHPWIVMELVPGESLADRLQRGPLLPREAAVLGRQILAALRAAHAAGIQHRDVKPANILLRADPGVPGPPSAVLTDFGIAALQGSTALTATGDLIGSPEYIAPERVRGRDAPASDLWSLGLVLYVAVEGHSPLRRATTLATLAAVLDEPVPPPVRSGPLAAVLGALLVRDPEARPDAATLDRLLAEAASGNAPFWAEPTVSGARPAPPAPAGAPGTPPPGAPAPAPYRPPHPTPTTAVVPPRRPTGALVAAAAALVAVAVAATALLLGPWRNDDLAEPGPGPAPTATGDPAGDGASKPSPDAGRSTGTDPDDDGEDGTGGTDEDPGAGPSPSAASRPPSAGSWIAQLFSEPVSTGTATRDRRLAAVRAEVPEARYLRSDDYASLRPGYWVFYVPGPFEDGRAALRFCAEKGRTSGNECVGRYLSDDRGDADAICHPPAGSAKGRCTRS